MLFIVSILRVHKSQIVIFIAHCFNSPLCFLPSVCSVFMGHLHRQELEQQRAETNEQTRLLRERLEHERRQGVWTLRGCQHLGVVERMCYSWFDDGMQLYSYNYVRFHKKIKPRNLGNWCNFTNLFFKWVETTNQILLCKTMSRAKCRFPHLYNVDRK